MPDEADQQGHGPTISRMLLGTQLRRLREEAGISPQVAGAHIRASEAKISRLELGRVGYKTRDIEDLLDLYGITDPAERAGFLAMAGHSNTRGWWSHDGDIVQGWFEMYLRLEQEASSVRIFEVQLVHGLLQCEEYAAAVLRAYFTGAPSHEIDRRVQLRLSRQKMLTEPGAPNLWAVLDESVLTRPVGPPAVMRAQAQYLLDLSMRPNVAVQILPFTAGGHAAMGGPFAILRFPVNELPDVVYLEQYDSATYIDRRPDVENYTWMMERLSVAALTPVQSRERIRALADSG